MEGLHRHPDYLPARKDHNETYQKPGYAAIPGKECGVAAEDQRPIDDSDLSKARVTISWSLRLTYRTALGGDAEDEFGSRYSDSEENKNLR